MKEYRGENIVDRLKARLLPPDAQYPDCLCDLILTERHLYVVESGNDRDVTHFVLFIERIRDMETQIRGVKYKRTAFGEMFLNGTLSLFAGIMGKKPEDSGVRLIITYDDGMGRRNKLYFKDLQSNANRFIKRYHERFQPLDDNPI